ncbi:MAG: PA14 domain-containing protein, partial [Caldilinea sp.]
MQNKFSHVLLRRFTWVFIAALLVGLAPANVHAQAPGGVLAGDGWLASYWNNILLSGAPVLTRMDADVNFDWGVGSPAPEVAVDNFSARWTRTLEVPQPGSYRFTLNSDDGSRLYLDGQLVINAWYDHGATRTFSATRTLDAGSHEVRVEYYERRGAAVVRFGWSEIGVTAPTPLP